VWRVPRPRVVFICSSHRPLADPLGRNRGLVSRTRCGALSRCSAEPGPIVPHAGPRLSSAPRRKSGAARAASGARKQCGWALFSFASASTSRNLKLLATRPECLACEETLAFRNLAIPEWLLGKALVPREKRQLRQNRPCLLEYNIPDFKA